MCQTKTAKWRERMDNYMSIKEMIRMVQDELIKSQKERIEKGQGVLFEASELEIELNTVVTMNDDGKMTISIPVIGLKGGLGISEDNQYIQKVKLKLKVSELDESFLPPNDNIRVMGRFPQYE